MKIILEINEQDKHHLDEMLAKYPKEAEIIQVLHFDGSSDLINVLITLSATTLPLVTVIIIELIRSKKHRRIKKDGMEIVGFSEKNTLIKKVFPTRLLPYKANSSAFSE